MIPLHIAHLPDVTAIAATSGVIISVAAVGAAVSASVAARLADVVPVGRLLFIELVAGGVLCGAMALAEGWITLLVLRTLVALCLGGALVPAESRGAAFGWLALGVQIGTAASPLVTGALAVLCLSAAYLMDGTLAWIAAAILLCGARDLLKRRDAAL